MRLVGASNWFIRTPFLMEGVVQSLVGALLAIVTLGVVWVYILPAVRELLPFLPLSLVGGDAVQVSLILVVGAVVIGLLGSGFALRRYLKV